MDRRRALGALAALPLIGAVGRRPGMRPDEAEAAVAELDARAGQPTRATLRAIIEAYNDVEHVLDTRASRDLDRAAARLAILGGSVEGDMGEPRWARRWFAAARAHASRAGDPHTLAWAYAREAVRVAWCHDGYPHRPEELADRGMAALPRRDRGRAGPAAVLLTRQAAATSSTRQALQLTERAEAVPTSATRLTDLALSEADRAHAASRVYARLGRLEDMLDRQRQAMAGAYSTDPIRRGYVNYERAHAMAGAGELDTAAVLGMQAWTEVPAAHRTVLLRRHARDLDEALIGCDSAAARDYRAARAA